MMAPQYLCCLYLATAGQQGNNLGSDEEEIVLLIYVIIDVAQNEVIGARQYLVKPSVADVNGNVLSEQVQMNSLLTEEMVKTAGQPLATVIYEFDRYLQSVLDIKSSTTTPSINGTTQQTLPQQQNGQTVPLHLTNFQFITDGQLPLRQCLHPECCSKNIELNDYYTLFFDLRKEVHKYLTVKQQQQHGLNGTQAVVPPVNTNSMNNLLAIAGEQQQITPMPTNITEMIEPLGLKRDIENEFYIKEAKDMVNIVKTLISNGHRFENPETINLVLEPGICLKSDKIESNCVVRARGLPWQSSDQDIAKFFIGLNIAKGGVALCLSAQGRRNGEALVRFCSQEHRDLALKRHKHHMGTRYIEVYEGNGDDFIGVAGGSSNEAQAFLSKGAAVIIRMRGLPYDCTAQQVLDFFSGGEHPCHVLDGTDGVLFVKKGDGRSTGDAFVLFAEEADASKALSKHRELIGSRYIELFRSTTAEVQQVLNRSMELQKYHGVVNQMPQILPHQLPPLPLLPQHIITSGTRKDCIRLRGLPYEAQVEHILEFLGEFAKNIVFQGVHMVYSSQGSPSGEAFIQMDSEKSAGLAAQQKHNRFMFSGKKHRYIEVFQCSGEDMNLVLNGGIPAPVSPRKGVATALISPGILPAPAGPAAGPTAGQPPTVPQINTTVAQIQQNLVTPNPALTWENPALYAQQQAQMIAQQNMLIKQHIASAQLAAIQAAQAQQQSELAYMNQFNNTAARQLPQGLFTIPGQPGLFQHQSPLLPPNFQFTQSPQHPLIYLPGAPRLPAPPQFQQPHSQMIGLKPPLIPTAAPPPIQPQPPVPTMIPQFIYQNSFVPSGGKRSYGDAFTPTATTESGTPSKRVANYANNVYTSVANSQIAGGTLIAPPAGFHGTTYAPHATGPAGPPGSYSLQPPIPVPLASPADARFYRHPLIIWPYPSPPVSPTNYYPSTLGPHTGPIQSPPGHQGPMLPPECIPIPAPLGPMGPMTPADVAAAINSRQMEHDKHGMGGHPQQHQALIPPQGNGAFPTTNYVEIFMA